MRSIVTNTENRLPIYEDSQSSAQLIRRWAYWPSIRCVRWWCTRCEKPFSRDVTWRHTQ